MTVKVHLDTDLGGDIDDLCALALLLRWPEGVQLTGVTTVGRHRRPQSRICTLCPGTGGPGGSPGSGRGRYRSRVLSL